VSQSVWLAANTCWYLYNFRARLIAELVRHGYEVVTLAPIDRYADELRALGASHRDVRIDNNGTNPFRDGALLARLAALIRQSRPGVLLTFTPKITIYCSIAARALRVPAVVTISGLGAGHVRGGWLRWIMRRLYRVALRRAQVVFFQNQEDQDSFVGQGLVQEGRARLVPGSGVDLESFRPMPRRHCDRFVFLFSGRLLGHKGVEEFVEAARTLRTRHTAVEFRLLGPLVRDTSSAISERQLSDWVQRGDVVYLGATDRVAEFLADADCLVLPTKYAEGCPKSLLEGASMGIPLIASDTSACRQVVVDGETGLLCKPGDAASLADAMERMLRLTSERRLRMGSAGRRRMETLFDEAIVVDRYMQAVHCALRTPAA
jgi:glycosyltransferase involved in cell wall biosynthesis